MTDHAHADATTICVLGMHRSGTSALAGVVQQLGAYVGPPGHLMAPRADNPAGFFEHQGLTDLNDEILRALGGVWQAPPPLPDGWHTAPALADIRARAARLLRDDFAGHRLWLWKDPRACLTLPFWRPLLPRVKTIVCVRHPLEVARSLAARDGIDLARGVDLWMRYTAGAVANAGVETVTVIYDDLLRDPEGEVERLAGFVGGAIDAAARAGAVAHVVAHGHLRHHAGGTRELFTSPDVPFATAALHALLVAMARARRPLPPRPDDLLDIASAMALAAPEAQAGERAWARLGGDAGPRALPEALAELGAARDEVRRLEADAAAARLDSRQARDLVDSMHTPAGIARAMVRASLPAPLLARVRAWRRRRSAGAPPS